MAKLPHLLLVKPSIFAGILFEELSAEQAAGSAAVMNDKVTFRKRVTRVCSNRRSLQTQFWCLNSEIYPLLLRADVGSSHHLGPAVEF